MPVRRTHQKFKLKDSVLKPNEALTLEKENPELFNGENEVLLKIPKSKLIDSKVPSPEKTNSYEDNLDKDGSLARVLQMMNEAEPGSSHFQPNNHSSNEESDLEDEEFDVEIDGAESQNESDHSNFTELHDAKSAQKLAVKPGFPNPGFKDFH